MKTTRVSSVVWWLCAANVRSSTCWLFNHQLSGCEVVLKYQLVTNNVANRWRRSTTKPGVDPVQITRSVVCTQYFVWTKYQYQILLISLSKPRYLSEILVSILFLTLQRLGLPRFCCRCWIRVAWGKAFVTRYNFPINQQTPLTCYKGSIGQSSYSWNHNKWTFEGKSDAWRSIKTSTTYELEDYRLSTASIG